MEKRYNTLIVDDALSMRLVLELCLKETEFQVVGQAVDGEDAVAKVKELNPDVVLMDIVMPGISGVDALKQIMSANPYVSVFMASSLGTEDMVNEAIKSGAKSFIQKPFVKEEVLRILREALD